MDSAVSHLKRKQRTPSSPVSLADYHQVSLLFPSILPGRTAHLVSLPQLSICLSPRNLVFAIASLSDHSVSGHFSALTSHGLSADLASCPHPLFHFSVSHSALSLTAPCTPTCWCCLGFLLTLSQSSPTPPTPKQAFILNTRFRFPAAYWLSQLGCLMGFQIQHATNRTQDLSPQTCSSPFALFWRLTQAGSTISPHTRVQSSLPLQYDFI